MLGVQDLQEEAYREQKEHFGSWAERGQASLGQNSSEWGGWKGHEDVCPHEVPGSDEGPCCSQRCCQRATQGVLGGEDLGAGMPPPQQGCSQMALGAGRCPPAACCCSRGATGSVGTRPHTTGAWLPARHRAGGTRRACCWHGTEQGTEAEEKAEFN